MHQHHLKGIVYALAVSGILFSCAPSLVAQQQTPADNTKTNTQDRAPGAVTADQQKNNATDRDITARIRRALMQDKGLSTYAHNVKVISENGQVTLKGPVRSEDEKRTVEAKATEVAGAQRVTDQMTIAPTKTAKH